MTTPEALRELESNPDNPEGRDGIKRYFKDLLRIKKSVNNAVEHFFEEHPELEKVGPNGKTPAQRAREEIEREERERERALRR